MTEYRFITGTIVMCNLGKEGWKLGRIISLNYREENWPEGEVAPYQVSLFMSQEMMTAFAGKQRKRM